MGRSFYIYNNIIMLTNKDFLQLESFSNSLIYLDLA